MRICFLNGKMSGFELKSVVVVGRDVHLDISNQNMLKIPCFVSRPDISNLKLKKKFGAVFQIGISSMYSEKDGL